MKTSCLLWLAALSACATGQPRPEDEKSASLRSQAAQDFSCAPDQVTRQPTLHRWLERASGCGKSLLYQYDYFKKQWISPLERAAFDLSCPRASLETADLGGTSVGVSGCGKKGVYVLGPREQWILNGSVSN
jgi:hypothetical protein